jgi:hypothetical protein
MLSPAEHNKYLGMAHVGYGAFHLLVTAAISIFLFGVMLPASQGGRALGSFFGYFIAFAFLLNVVLSVPPFVAGYAFLKRKRWAKIAGIIAAVVAAIRVPFGTAVAIYTFWFLFSAPGKILYDNSAQALPPAPPADWSAADKAQRAHEYPTRTSPPDWR